MIRLLRWGSLLATLTLTAQFEWHAGVFVGLDWRLALALPLAVDCYAMAALLTGRDRGFALVVLWCSVAAGAVHAATDWRVAGMGILLASFLTLVLWRVDELFRHDLDAKTAARAAATERAAQAERDAVAVRAREVAAAERAANATTERPARPKRTAPTNAPANADALAARRRIHDTWKTDPSITAGYVAAELGCTPAAARGLLKRFRDAEPQAVAL
jgi:hypothetical protein